MSEKQELQTSLRQRINEFLRGTPTRQNRFTATLDTSDATLLEYRLKRAEAELRIIQERVEQLRKEMQKYEPKLRIAANI